MHWKPLQILVFCIILVLFGLSVRPISTVEADTLLQDTPGLNGYKIYFTESNGESSRFDRSVIGLSRFAGLLSELGAELETLEWRTNFPADADLIIIAGPVDDFSADQTARLWTYLNNGGKILLLADPIQIDRGRDRGFRSDSGLFQLLWSDFGVRLRNDIVLTEGFPQATPQLTSPITDVEAATEEAIAEATAEMTEKATPSATPTPQTVISALPAPLVNFATNELNTDHVITQGLSSLNFFTSRSLDIDLSIRNFPVEPLVFSSSEFYGENNLPEYYTSGLALYNISQDTQAGFLTLAVAYENPENDVRLIIVGDRQFATNGSGLQSSPSNTGAFLYPDNVRFLLNSVTWLLGARAVEVDFPTPGPTATATPIPTPINDALEKPDAELGITISVSNVRPIESEIILYNISLINNGPDPVTNVVVTDVLPTSLEFILASGGTYRSDIGEWKIDTLQPSEAATLRLVVRVVRGTVGTTVTNHVEITSSDANDSEPDNNSASADITIATVLLREEGQ